jgi:hypothetical protein
LAASLAALPCTQAHSYEQTYCSARTGETIHGILCIYGAEAYA